MALGVPAIDLSTKKFADDDIPAALALDPRFNQGTGRLPTGGVAGQVLTKQSPADYDTAWETPDTSGTGTPPTGEGATTCIVMTDVAVPDTVPPATQWDEATQTGTADAHWAAALDLSHATGLPIWIPPGNWAVTATKTDISARVMRSPGVLIQRKGQSVLKLTHNVGAPMDVTAIRHIWVVSNDTGNPEQSYAVFDVSPAAMAANTPNQGDAFLLTSSEILPGDFIGDGENTFAAEWVTVGVSE